MAMRRRDMVISLCATLLGTGCLQAATLGGDIRDLNGKPVAGALVSVSTALPGPTVTTAFADAAGHFALPPSAAYTATGLKVAVRALGYELLDSRTRQVGRDALELTLVVKATENQVQTAPASAWLGRVKDHDANAQFILDCVGCHQVPGGQFRLYAGTIADIPGPDRTDIARQAYGGLVKYMNFISAEEFSRGPNPPPLDAHNVYSVGNGESVVKFLSTRFPGRMESLSGYSWGAPLAVTPKTAIYEYEFARPNAVREALLIGSPAKLYAADVASNRLLTADPVTGQTGKVDIPWKDPVGPHSLHRDADGSLWVTPFVVSAVSHLDPKTGAIRTYPLKTAEGKGVGIHDLGAGAQHTVLPDKRGRIWFSDIVNDAVGSLDPKSGKIEIFPAPKVKGREGNGSLYGFVMASDREHVWYSEVAIGHLGSFNTRTKKFEDSVVLPANSGPRRIAIDDQDVLWVALYGSGQLLAYDTRSHKQIGLYDLPDRASAPYATTWDPVRKVVWVPTSNADVIYKFNPADKSTTVLPLPRQGAFLRMVDVDPDSGRLITSYANIVEQVHGPRMALIIEPGDGAYEGRKTEGAR
jgi:virginiamycin B lyase